MAEGYFELRPVGPYSFGASVRYEGRRSGLEIRSRPSRINKSCGPSVRRVTWLYAARPVRIVPGHHSSNGKVRGAVSATLSVTDAFVAVQCTLLVGWRIS
jgi:hypothetical protein